MHRVIRPAQPQDHRAISALLDAAFAPSRGESSLLEKLWRRRKPVHEWVVEDERGIVAHIAYTRAFRDQAPIGYHLGPLAVHPHAQRQGLGSKLVRASLAALAPGNLPIFVLGSPDYYSRFGFTLIQHPRCPFDPTNRHFLARNCLASAAFIVGYEPEFSELSA